MHFSAIIVATLASMAMAVPSGLSARGGGGGSSSGGSGSGGSGSGSGGSGSGSGGSGSGSGGSGSGSGGEPSSYNPCSSGLYGLAYCCEANVGQVLGVTCSEVSTVPTSAADYKKACGADVPSCCAVGLLGLGVLCTTPEGT